MNDFDKIIKDKIGSIEEMPPAHLWANISKGIAVPQAAAIPFYKSSKFIISAAVASIVVVMGAMWFFADSNTIDNKTPIIVDTEYNNGDNTIANEDQTNEIGTEPQSKDAVDQQQQIVDKKNAANNTNIEKAAVDIAPFDDQPNNDTKQYKRKMMSYKAESVVSNDEGQPSHENSDNSSKEEALLLVSLTQTVDKDVVANNESVQTSEVENIEENAIVEETIEETNEETSIANVDPEEKTSNVEVAETENTEVVKTTEKENVAEESEENAIVSNNTTSTPDDEMPKSEFNPRTTNYDRMSIGAHFGLENIKVDDINIATYNGDISFNYQNMNFIAQTGIGLQMSKDKNDYNQHISTSEFQATQIRFDSIIFVSDGNGGITPTPVDPTYVDVYDTVNHVYESDVTETYYSIRIPLMIGYQKSFKKFGVFGKGGIIFSHIFKNDTGNMNEVDNNSVVLSTDYQLAERRSNQLQYVLSTGVSYAISKRMSFNAELMGKYYQYAMYTNSNYESNPWSYEARVGITYLLN